MEASDPIISCLHRDGTRRQWHDKNLRKRYILGQQLHLKHPLYEAEYTNGGTYVKVSKIS